MERSNTASTRGPARDRGAADERLAVELRRRAAGLSPGARFPSVRALMEHHAASPVTVHRAVARLVREGLLVARPGDGTYVSAAGRSERRAVDSSWQLTVLGADPDPLESVVFAPPTPGHVAMGAGYPDATLQPQDLLRRAAQRASRRAQVWDRVPVEGHPELRRWFARDVGGGALADDVLLVPGGQAALATTLRTLVPAGGAVLVEAPTYFGALAVCRAQGLRPVPIPLDEEGLRVDLLAAALASSGARVVYVQPAFANPTGATMSPARRHALLEVARRAGAFVIEDDYARDLAFAAVPPPPLFRDGEDCVVYLRSLTKSTAAGLRVAAIVARGPVVARLRAMRAVEDSFLSGLLQEVALDVVTAPGWGPHLRALRTALRVRRDVLLEGLAAHLPEARVHAVPAGGFSVWVALPPGVDDRALVEAAARERVQITPGSVWFVARTEARYVRLSTACAEPRAIEQGVRVVAACARELSAASAAPRRSVRARKG